MTFQKRKLVRIVIIIPAFVILIFVIQLFNIHNTLEFSLPSGFYNEPQTLEIRGRGRIFYTLDCTDPTEESIPYTGPIEIKDASCNPNVYSVITEVSPYLSKKLLELNLVQDYGYIVPEEPVDKATIVRAISIDVFGNKSKIMTRVYFIGFQNKQEYDGINIMSIVTDPKNLFDYEEGIYIMGVDFDNRYFPIDMTKKNNYYWAEANYRRKGKESRKTATISVWNKELEAVGYGEYIISIQGGGTRAELPKNINIYRMAGSTALHKEVFGESQESFNLFAGGQDKNTKIMDRIVNEQTRELNISTRSFIPYILFLDGEYWGFYYLTERFDESYFKNVYGIEKKEMMFIKNSSVEIGENKDIKEYEKLIETISKLDMSDQHNYDYACRIIDIDSIMDYYAVELYIANVDWPNSNTGLWKSRYIGRKPYEDEKWRYVLFDLNSSMNIGNASLDVERIIKVDNLFASLMNNEDFSRRLKERLVYLANDIFNPIETDKIINSYEIETEAAIIAEYERYYGNKKQKDYRLTCEEIKSFFHRRHEYIVGRYGDYQQ